MRNGNRNHPPAGSRIVVEPIREMKDIQAIRKIISNNCMYAALFDVGINTALRASDLLSLKIGQVRGLKPMGELDLTEKKTGKARKINLNRTAINAINTLLRDLDDKAAKGKIKSGPDDPLFQGQRGLIKVQTLSQLVKLWCRHIHLKGNYASHTLRKTFGYHQRKTFGVGLPELCDTYGHSSQRQTLTYLCIQPDEVRNVYANEI